jgi:hypothetical protein
MLLIKSERKAKRSSNKSKSKRIHPKYKEYLLKKNIKIFNKKKKLNTYEYADQ